MDILDIIILIVVALCAFAGYQRGMTWVGLSVAGIVAGTVLGALVAPPLATALSHGNNSARAFIGSGVFLGCILIVEGIGTTIGFTLRSATIRSRARWITTDSAGGSLLAGLATLAFCWYLGLIFVGSPIPALDRQIRGSTIETWLDHLAPRPPGFLGSVSSVLQGNSFPDPFATIYQKFLPPVQIPASANTKGIIRDAGLTVKVVARGCGGIESGSGWPAAPHYIVTNAHVVAGGANVMVFGPENGDYPATVVFFDPKVDVAVLYVPGLSSPALPVQTVLPSRGTTGAVIGYPGGGVEQVVPAAVRGSEEAEGWDIYGNALVTREIEAIAARVIPGNSGGPLVADNGAVIGMVFAASTIYPNEGYALSVGQIEPDIHAGLGSTTAVSTQSCANG